MFVVCTLALLKIDANFLRSTLAATRWAGYDMQYPSNLVKYRRSYDFNFRNSTSAFC